MRTVFRFDEKKEKLEAFSFVTDKSVSVINNEFLRNSSKFKGYGDAVITTSNVKYGSKRLIWQNDDVVFQELADSKYLGQELQSNVGCTSNGCDHYYEDVYQYTYFQRKLPKYLSDAFLILYNFAYYGHTIRDYCDYPQRHSNESLLEMEKRTLQFIKDKLKELSDDFRDYGCEDNLLMVTRILRSISPSINSYDIRSDIDFKKALEDKRYIGRYVVSLYLHEKSFDDVKEFLEDLNNESLSIEGKVVREIIDSFALTPDWLNVTHEIHDKQEKVLKLWREWKYGGK